MKAPIQNRATPEEFIANFPAHARRLKDSGQAELIETNDATDVVVVSADTFDRLLDHVALETSAADLRDAFEETRAGVSLDAEQALTKLRRELGLAERV